MPSGVAGVTPVVIKGLTSASEARDMALFLRPVVIFCSKKDGNVLIPWRPGHLHPPCPRSLSHSRWFQQVCSAERMSLFEWTVSRGTSAFALSSCPIFLSPPMRLRRRATCFRTSSGQISRTPLDRAGFTPLYSLGQSTQFCALNPGAFATSIETGNVNAPPVYLMCLKNSVCYGLSKTILKFVNVLL
ncbi:hypothetical protein AVEN_73186-1 [Araneus ventricosus]|uniref:Uncharacterized protein n=1 Tax=Araneus ventricosus TaxID=182803 RepID=A0A4Y2K8W7_ARAVE|nr:hypothetical protein AVEN_73186-1 [Araneus ventricosus]